MEKLPGVYPFITGILLWRLILILIVAFKLPPCLWENWWSLFAGLINHLRPTASWLNSRCFPNCPISHR
jgi:hypothetical protein